MRRASLIAMAGALALLATAGVAAAAGSGGPAHGMAMHGAPKYAADFKHFDYVDQNARNNFV